MPLAAALRKGLGLGGRSNSSAMLVASVALRRGDARDAAPGDTPAATLAYDGAPARDTNGAGERTTARLVLLGVGPVLENETVAGISPGIGALPPELISAEFAGFPWESS
jgi:hypothetical protein